MRSGPCEQIGYSIQTHMIYCISRLLLYDGLRMISDADPGLFHHFEVIGAIADGDYLLPLQAQFFAHSF